MKSRILIGISGGIFTIVVFILGFITSIYLMTSTDAASYAKEHVDNGRFMLYALKNIEDGEIEKARTSLRSHVSMKVLLVDSFRLPPTSEREDQLIKDFYMEVADYFNSQGGFNETMKVMENGEWVTKPTPTMEILKGFSTK
ncbi:hypothetical protein [Alteromonas mediterranea]|jgi:hypothetical protein|uniref:Uncharacterized protein n=1 Tax=Alteromonas mediterranea (strain DSM 17117 / CIP 110805 / LMG 28347 / Deep ecotype) TaxID=1774373 RepID=F2G451_ALTMD|nr:hypothetical protein [Alteromonas mediterranea]AEA98338.1 hypothetical protein MADE_1011000 [Alteromonas mediterranea DE]CAH1200073.1 hypothetical protein ISS312_03249 [Alteromonas mediterranea]